MKRRTAWFLAAGVVAVAVGAASVGAVALLLRGGGGWGGERCLVVRLHGNLPEQPPPAVESLLDREPPTVWTVVESLDRAAKDPDVRAAVVRVGSLEGSGWGKVQDLREAISRFRRSGKPAFAHLDSCGNKEYYLATACTRIYAVPTALIEVTGLSMELTFFRRTLDKLGVQAQFEGVGRYKSAPSRFTEAGLTEPDREQTEALLDGLFAQYISAISAARRKSPEEVRALVDGGPYHAPEALEAGLVDELLYPDELDAQLGGGRRVAPGPYVRSARRLWFDRRPRLALIYAVGEIVPGASQRDPFGGRYAGSDTVGGALRRARDDGSIRGVLLRVDSPGGVGTAADLIWREVVATSRVKPVVVSMGDVAASGGYYIAMGSDAILAQPGTLTGSIGVFSGKFSLRGLYDKIGLTREILTRGRNAALFTDYRPWSQEERARIRSLNQAFYDEFVRKAAHGRRRAVLEVESAAQGRVWSGAEALERGLVDRLGGMAEALALAKQKAGIPAERDVALVLLPERKGLLETLLERHEEGLVQQALPGEARSLLRWPHQLAEGPLARLPFEIRIR